MLDFSMYAMEDDVVDPAEMADIVVTNHRLATMASSAIAAMPSLESDDFEANVNLLKDVLNRQLEGLGSDIALEFEDVAEWKATKFVKKILYAIRRLFKNFMRSMRRMANTVAGYSRTMDRATRAGWEKSTDEISLTYTLAMYMEGKPESDFKAMAKWLEQAPTELESSFDSILKVLKESDGKDSADVDDKTKQALMKRTTFTAGGHEATISDGVYTTKSIATAHREVQFTATKKEAWYVMDDCMKVINLAYSKESEKRWFREIEKLLDGFRADNVDPEGLRWSTAYIRLTTEFLPGVARRLMTGFGKDVKRINKG